MKFNGCDGNAAATTLLSVVELADWPIKFVEVTKNE
jgi:hypothetical protein